ncbi:Hypothetical protein ETEE_3739 [Edwardsiella anguillarum ET080813]|uniref:Uncharacterized protein n=1 Tax=Edwardsiella anguillarum ET080813 TaxID=667120 RepID=A0A076LQ96_9GAMM|nr:Hypothetical protein ETEE_3739 [Edwardsiella anguillarum ET080813]
MLLYLMILEKDDNLVQSNTIIANNQIITLLFIKIAKYTTKLLLYGNSAKFYIGKCILGVSSL